MRTMTSDPRPLSDRISTKPESSREPLCKSCGQILSGLCLNCMASLTRAYRKDVADSISTNLLKRVADSKVFEAVRYYERSVPEWEQLKEEVDAWVKLGLSIF